MLRLFHDLRALFNDAADKLEHFESTPSFTFKLPSLPDGIDRDRLFHLHNADPLVVEVLTGNCELDLVCRRDGEIHWKCGSTSPGQTNIVYALRTLTRMFCVGPFRPFHPSGAGGTSHDALVGSDFFDLCADVHSGPCEGRATLRSVGADVASLFGLDEFQFAPKPDGTPGFRVNGDWLPHGEIGSGIGQSFLVFLQAALHRPSFVLIDEPEAHIHPSLQADFLTQLAGYGEFGLMASTHHLGLARSVSDHLYEISRSPDGGYSEIHRYRPEKRLSQTLGELQVPVRNGTRSHHLLLVEGPTEIKALRKLLSKIRRDHSVVLLPLGGSSMINGNREDELLEITKIGDRVSALIDSERRAEGERESPHHRAFRESCQKVGIRCHILERRALENYFSDRAVREVLGTGFRAPGPFEDLKDVHPKWPKSDNWKIVQNMRRDEFAGTDLMEFCESLCR